MAEAEILVEQDWDWPFANILLKHTSTAFMLEVNQT
jgi:hypothetical protein